MKGSLRVCVCGHVRMCGHLSEYVCMWIRTICMLHFKCLSKVFSNSLSIAVAQ